MLTTVGNWRQPWHDMTFRGRGVSLVEALRVPRSSSTSPAAPRNPSSWPWAATREADQRMLMRQRLAGAAGHGRSPRIWTLYRKYLRDLRGEFTVAKDQNVRLRSGWFSERMPSIWPPAAPSSRRKPASAIAFRPAGGCSRFPPWKSISGRRRCHELRTTQCTAGPRRKSPGIFNYDVVLKRFLRDMGIEVR